jgi:hypothetical protein
MQARSQPCLRVSNTTMSLSADPTTTRGANGQVLKGNGGGPGNPHAAQVARLRAALMSRVSEEDIAAMADQLVAMAKEGSLQAIKLVFQYVLGKPGPIPEPPPEAPAPAAKEEARPRATTQAPKPAVVPDVSPELLREIERAILPASVGLSLCQPAVTKRGFSERSATAGDGERRGSSGRGGERPACP